MGAECAGCSTPSGGGESRGCACRLGNSGALGAGEVIDAQGVDGLLDLTQRSTFSAYRRDNSAMARPVLDLAQDRCKLWLRTDILEPWLAEWLARSGR